MTTPEAITSASASTIRLGFEMGLYTRDDVGAWVDARVASCNEVSGPLLELTTLKHKYESEILHHLTALEESATDQTRFEDRIAVIAKLLEIGRITPEYAANRLFSLVLYAKDGIDLGPVKEAAYYFDDALDIAFANVEAQIRDFFRPHAARFP